MTRLETKHRFPAAILALVWVCAPVLGLLHVIHEKHTYCAEHSRLEEKSHARSQTHGHHEDSQLLVENLGESEDADHEDCAFGESFTRDAVEPEVGDVSTSQNENFAWLPAAATAHERLQIELLHIAPKSSPPLRA